MTSDEPKIWTMEQDGEVLVGIMPSLLDELGGELSMIDVLDEGAEVEAGDVLATLEGVKSVYELKSPVDGVVVAAGTLEQVNGDCGAFAVAVVKGVQK